MASANPGEIRNYLDDLLEWESAAVHLEQGLHEVLSREKFTNPLGMAHADLQRFCDELSAECIPLIRHMRIELILDIARRAQQSGLDVIPLSDALRHRLLTSTVEEVNGWHETAYLLADVDEAKRLDQSIKDARTSGAIEQAGEA